MHTPDLGPPPLKGNPPPYPARPAGAVPITAKAAGTFPDKYIGTLVELVSKPNLQARVNNLSAFHTRHSFSTFIDQVANWLVGLFQGFGYTDVALVPYTFQGVTLNNVVCTKPGSGGTGQLIIVCGHYDCIMQNHSDFTARAPGANDNASGISALLEMARIIQTVDVEDTVQFVAFSGEEQGLRGSGAYAAQLAADGTNVHRLINMDMIGFPPPLGTITIEEDTGNLDPSNDAASGAFADVMAQMALDYTDLPVHRAGIYGSDYMPFEQDGVVVIGAFDGEGNPNYHSDTDTPATLDYDYLGGVTRMALATLLSETLSVVDEADSPVDLYIRDSDADTGEQPSSSPHWRSPDIWVRNNPPPGDDPTLGHQVPITNQPNYLYVQVHNRGSVDAAAGVFAVETFHCDPGTGMIWPDHFTSIGTLTVNDAIPAGGSVTVGPFNWTPTVVDHECLLAVVSGMGDHAISEVYSGQINHGILVRNDNNVGQRNVSPKASVPGGKTKTSFTMRGGLTPTTNKLTLDANEMPNDTKISVRTLRRIVDGSVVQNLDVTRAGSVWMTFDMNGGSVAVIDGFALRTNDEVTVELTIDFSLNAEHLKVYPLVATQEQDSQLAGRMTIEITSVKELEDWVFGNPRSRELHVIQCPFWPLISPWNKIPYETIDDGLARGYNGCRFCLPEHDTG